MAYRLYCIRRKTETKAFPTATKNYGQSHCKKEMVEKEDSHNIGNRSNCGSDSSKLLLYLRKEQTERGYRQAYHQ